ncbi:Uncharacterised protein [Acinetobacter nosocomialis]|nr:Uncharacterised protein [Acinetobacter nosocomialis]SSQ88357.1 Uncharacterised protein [Acinetobacter nosocomialis]
MTIKYYDLDNTTPIVVDLTLGELTDIYFTILEQVDLTICLH